MNKCSEYDEIVKKILNNPLDYEWELQGFGMLRTYIDKDTRMQIWLNSFLKGETYDHSKDVPHRIDFIDGTITILTKRNKEKQSFAYSYVKSGREWVSAAPRPATKKEILTFIDAAKRLRQED